MWLLSKSYYTSIMSDDQFTRLFKYMQREFGKIHARLEQTASKESVDRLTNFIDAQAKRTEIYEHEMLALGHKVDCHEQWILKVAEAGDVELLA